VAVNPQTKPIDFGCESAENWQLQSTSTIAIVIITRPLGSYSCYRPTDRGWKAESTCIRGAQPVPKAVYRSGCRDKHNWRRCDLNLGPLTLQSDSLTTRPLRPVTYFRFVDDVLFAYKLRLLGRRRQAESVRLTRSLGLGA